MICCYWSNTAFIVLSWSIIYSSISVLLYINYSWLYGLVTTIYDSMFVGHKVMTPGIRIQYTYFPLSIYIYIYIYTYFPISVEKKKKDR